MSVEKNTNINSVEIYNEILKKVTSGAAKELSVQPTDTEGYCCDAVYEYEGKEYQVYLSKYSIQSYEEQIADAIFKEDQQWSKECDIWYEFYQTFNDNNTRHANNAFYNNGCGDMPAMRLHAENLNWVKEIAAHGVSFKEICECMPNAKSYVEEFVSSRKMNVENKQNMYCIIKREDAEQFLTKADIKVLDGFLRKIELGRASLCKKPRNEYYVCNVDEPYAEDVYNAIVNGEQSKGNAVDIAQKESEMEK